MSKTITGYDFCGWATKNDLKCADGRIIRHGAFSGADGMKVPLVWNHQHNSNSNVLGHAILENRDDGVYAYGFFNNTPAGRDAKEQVRHGDVSAISIWANNLQQIGSEVLHGAIREVSLVLAGANPGAFIESVVAHSEPMGDDEDEGIFYTDESIEFAHSSIDINDESDNEDNNVTETEETEAESSEETDTSEDEENADDTLAHSDESSDKTVEEVYDSMTDDQKALMIAYVSAAIEGTKNSINKGETEMKHNLFEGEAADNSNILSHSDIETIISTAKEIGSMKKAFRDYTDGGALAHSIDTTGMETAVGSSTYGFNDPDMLFPEYRQLNGNKPEFISRRMEWVDVVLNGVHRSPFSRVKSVYANITEDAARAKGYIKGHQKATEVFSTLKRTTDPTTIYKLQKMDRDDIIDITDFDVVVWIKGEMRIMLDEEIARAILIGDGRLPDDEYKIKEDHIRPIATDVPLFNIKFGVQVASGASRSDLAKQFMDDAIRARKNYKGSGNPVMFTTEDMLTEMLLLKDDIGHKLYKSEAEVATALRVSKVVTVEPMEGHTIEIDGDDKDLLAIVINLSDYNVGADKGGAIDMFEDFDIDFNKYTYLIETRISGALIKPFSAITLYKKVV